MVSLLLLVCALAGSQLNADILWLDEMYSLGNMGVFEQPFSPAQVTESLAEHSADHVPLYFALGAAWAQVAGWSQVAHRYLSLLFGALLLAWVFRFAADAADRSAGLLAATLLGTSGFVVLYFHEIRMYALLLLLMMAHLWLYWRLLAGRGRVGRGLLCFALATVALLYTHVFSLFYFAGLYAHHLVMRRGSRNWFRLLLAGGLGALCFLPYLPVVAEGFRASTTNFNMQALSLPTQDLLVILLEVAFNDVAPLSLAMLVLCGIALGRPQRALVLRLCLVLAVMLAAMLALNAIMRVISALRVRYFLILMPPLCVVFACCLRAAPHRGLVVLFLLVYFVGGWQIWRQAENWRYAGHQTLLMSHPPLQRFADSARSQVRPHDYMLGIAPSPVINWRLKHGYSKADYYTQVMLGIDGGFVNGRLRGEDLLRDIEARIDDNPYLLFAYDPSRRHTVFPQVEGALESDYHACAVLADSDQVFVQRYVYKSLACDRDYQPIHYSEGIRIVDYFADFDAPAGTIRLVTGWEVDDEALLELYNVSFQVLRPDWSKAIQAPDSHLYGEILKWHVVELSTADLDPGDYRVVVIVYDRYQSSAKLDGWDLTTGERGAILPLLHFKMEGPGEA